MGSPPTCGQRSNRRRNKTAVKALSVKLSDEEIKSLEEPYIPHPLVEFE
jgi:hypothetical protein